MYAPKIKKEAAAVIAATAMVFFSSRIRITETTNHNPKSAKEKIFFVYKDADLLMQKLKKYMLEFVLRGVNYSFGFSKHPLIPFFVPPYDILKCKKVKKVVLYGAGRVGQDYFQSFQTSKFIDVVLWVDRQYEEYRMQGLSVDAVEDIINTDFDGILIAIENENLANRIKKNLTELGIQETLLIWEKPKKIVDGLEEEFI